MSNHLPRIRANGQSNQGKRNRNEDFFKILIPARGMSQESLGALCIVADGMGGIGGGDIASKSATEEIIRTYYGSEAGEDDELAHEQRLLVALESANAYVRKRATEAGLQRIGTAIAGVILLVDKAILFNVGDCRIYHIRQGKLASISRDQSVMAQRIESGTIKTGEERTNSNLTAFLGQPTPIQPECHMVPVEIGDSFVLCTDGLWSLVKDEEIVSIVNQETTQSATNQLIQLAIGRGTLDNVTVITIKLHETALNRVRRFFLGGMIL